MKSEIKILHLEDNPVDVEFISAALMKDDKFDIRITQVENRHNFEAALSSQTKYDFILSDYSLPGFDAFSAFKIAREKFPDIPFIIISGESTEQIVIESINIGVTDYILKNQVQMLLPLVRRALKENEQRIKYKRAEECQLQLSCALEAKRKAEEKNYFKNIFLSNMSHELRTPLIGITGCAQILYEELNSPELKEMAEIIINSGNTLTETINQILNLSKIESDSVDLELNSLDAGKILRKIISRYEIAAAKKGLYLHAKIKNGISIKADKNLLDQVLNNLLGNAFKYTKQGGVTVSLNLYKKNKDEFAIIQVTDTGIGIPEKQITKIFEPFRQGSEGFNREYQGVGIGLTIVKKFVEKMNGELMLESDLQKGSVFSILIPVAAENKITAKLNEEPAGIKSTEFLENKKNILIVEDDKTNRDIIKIFLKDEYNFADVSSGEEAINLVKEKIFDVILLDINLKGMNGLDAVHLIRKVPGYDNIPIIAVTAYAMAGDDEKFLAAGCSHYLAKPFVRMELLDMIKTSINDGLVKKTDFETLCSRAV